jgi:hypothetical protein
MASIVLLLLLVYKKRLALLYAIPPLFVLGLTVAFYVYLLTNKPQPSIIGTILSSYLRFIERSVDLGAIIAFWLSGRKVRKIIDKKKITPS